MQYQIYLNTASDFFDFCGANVGSWIAVIGENIRKEIQSFEKIVHLFIIPPCLWFGNGINSVLQDGYMTGRRDITGIC